MGILTGPRIALDPASLPRRSLTIAAAAELLSVDRSTVRKWLRSGEIEGHRIGRRALRVYADSIEDYRSEHAIAGRAGTPSRCQPKRAPRLTAAHREAEAFLQSLGVSAMIPK